MIDSVKRVACLLLLAPMFCAFRCSSEVGDGLSTSVVTVLISATPNDQAANGASLQPVLSGDGSLVAFSTQATNLGITDSNGKFDIYVKDRRNQSYDLVSLRSPENTQMTNDSFNPGMTSDGRFVVFESDGHFEPQVLAGPFTTLKKIWRRDRQLGVTTLVSCTNALGSGFPDAECVDASISDDGRFVAFVSRATNMGPVVPAATDQVWIRDMSVGKFTAGAVKLASRTAIGDGGNDQSRNPAVSGNGRFFVFQSKATNLDTVDPDGDSAFDIYALEYDTTGPVDILRLVSLNTFGVKADEQCQEASVSRNGNFIAYATSAGNILGSGGTLNIVRREGTGATPDFIVIVSTTASGALADLDCGLTAISADGQFVAFWSVAPNLGAGPTFDNIQLFLRDVQGGLGLVSVSSAGELADVGSVLFFPSFPSVSGDGRFVAFDSPAANLAPGDGNGFPDVFVRGPR